MKKNYKILVFTLILVIIGIFVILESNNYGKEGAFPKFLGGILILSSLLNFYKENKEPFKENGKEKINYKILFIIILILIYAFILKYLGYIFSTMILSICVFHILNYKTIKSNIPVALLLTLITFFCFKILLSISLDSIF